MSLPAAPAVSCISAADRTILRELARRVAERAAHPIQQQRIALWKNHNDLKQPARPVLYISPEGSWDELLPPDTLRCVSETARLVERDLRRVLYAEEHFRHDLPVLPHWNVCKAIHDSGWDLQSQRIQSSASRGAWHFDPVIRTEADLEKIRMPVITHDEAESRRRLEEAEWLFGDILPVRSIGWASISFHMMALYTGWRGLEETMCDMYDEPEMLHRGMALLEQGYRGMVEQCLEQGLLEPNNNSSYHNSGGTGWSNDFPSKAADADLRLGDLWASAEAQEMAQVSPAQHREFVMEYEKRLLAPFGRTGYGCCEDLTHKLDDVFTIPQIRRISISPWADVPTCAEKLGLRYVFSWKPHPSHLVGQFDLARVRAYLRQALEQARRHGCFMEIILKDTHTCDQRPERFDAWCEAAREEIRRLWPESPYGFDD